MRALSPQRAIWALLSGRQRIRVRGLCASSSAHRETVQLCARTGSCRWGCRREQRVRAKGARPCSPYLAEK